MVSKFIVSRETPEFYKRFLSYTRSSSFTRISRVLQEIPELYKKFQFYKNFQSFTRDS